MCNKIWKNSNNSSLGCSALCWKFNASGSYSWLWTSEMIGFAKIQQHCSLETFSESCGVLCSSQTRIWLCTPVCHKTSRKLATLHRISKVNQPNVTKFCDKAFSELRATFPIIPKDLAKWKCFTNWEILFFSENDFLSFCETILMKI